MLRVKLFGKGCIPRMTNGRPLHVFQASKVTEILFGQGGQLIALEVPGDIQRMAGSGGGDNGWIEKYVYNSKSPW